MPSSCQEILPTPDLNMSPSVWLVFSVNKVNHWWTSQGNLLCIYAENRLSGKKTKIGEKQVMTRMNQMNWVWISFHSRTISSSLVNCKNISKSQNYNFIRKMKLNKHFINSYRRSTMFSWINRLTYMCCLWMLRNTIIWKKGSSYTLLIVKHFPSFSWRQNSHI